MSKITRLEQLVNENSIYRVSGVFDKSEICEIYRVRGGLYVFDTELIPYRAEPMEKSELKSALSNGSVTIMCLQRGEWQ